MSTKAFIYFDLGNVLVHFDPGLAVRQVAEVLDTGPDRVQTEMYDSGLELKLESGELSDEEFLEELFTRLGTTAAPDDIFEAMSAMFTPNLPVFPIVSKIIGSGFPTGVLSNTCRPHWDWLKRQDMGIVRTVGQPAVLSYEAKCLKPSAEIYRIATEEAQSAPEEIVFVDDRPENVEAANQFGWTAIQFTSSVDLIRELRDVGIQCFV